MILLKGFIYCVTCKITYKCYFGQTSRNIFERWKQHVKDALFKDTSNHKFHRAIRKYGAENFIIEEVMFVESSTKKGLKCKLDYLEQHFIRRYDTKRNGYNSTWGGDGTLGCHWKISEIGRQNISKGHKGLKFSDEHRRKISESKKGHFVSIEVKNKISKAHKGKKLSKETLEKLSKARKGMKFSDEHRRKISESHKGNKNGFYGKHHSIETKLKMSKPILEFSENNEFKRKWTSISKIKVSLNVSRNTIRKAIRNKILLRNSYWKYEK